MYQIDCRNITSFDDFIDVFNEVLIEPAGGNWNGNLDAFNDYLSWPEDTPYKLIILGTDRCEQVLNNLVNGRQIWQILKEILANNQEFALVEFK